MPISQRQHIRFSLDIPAFRYTKFGEKLETLINQISIGGCLSEWDENVFTGDEFRLELQLPNKNWLPLKCKVLYKFENNGIGIKFLDITRFEQELISTIIAHSLEKEGLPMEIDAFSLPHRLFDENEPRITDILREREKKLEQIMSGDTN